MDQEKVKKFFTYLLAVFFLVIFALVGIGSCGGIQYLREKNQKTAYAMGTDNTADWKISVTVAMPLEYSTNGFRLIDNTETDMIEFNWIYPIVFEQDASGLYLVTFQYSDSGIVAVRELISMELTLFGAAVASGPDWIINAGFECDFTSDLDEIPSYGKLVSVEQEVSSGLNAPQTLSLTFESGDVMNFFIYMPYRATQYGDFEVNSYTRFSGRFKYVVPDTQVSISEAVDNAYNNGFDEGSTDGYNRGFNAGKIEGAAQANDYSFISLLGAVIDVPVQAFLGLTDFSLFGFDMSTLYKSLFAFAAIIVVMRVILP